MPRVVKTAALGLLCALIATPVVAQNTPLPALRQDRAGPSVYLAMQREPAPNALPAAPVSAVVAQSANSDARHLAPPTSGRAVGNGAAKSESNEGKLFPAGRLPNFGLPLESLYTVLSGLAIVLGVFLLFAWLMRRGSRRNPSALPAEVVSVLGRVQLAARQVAELLRVGNKLVLVSISTSGTETITEVTDPAEVDRLVGLCQQDHPRSTTKAFEQVFRQLSRSSTSGGFAVEDALPVNVAAAAFHANRGDIAHA